MRILLCFCAASALASAQENPRAAVLGFVSAAHRQDYAAAAQFLNTPLQGAPAQDLARQLSRVLDARLPARIDQLSDQPDGSLNDNLPLSQELVGRIQAADEPFPILLERVAGGGKQAWLFSAATMQEIPGIYQEINPPSAHALWFGIAPSKLLALGLLLGLTFVLSGFLRRAEAPV